MRGTRLADDVRTPLRVPGFVVVAAADRAVEVTRDEIERFASAYEAICGRSRRRSYTGDTFARVIEFGRDDETAPAGGSWTVTAGAAHGDEGQFARVSYEQSSRAVVVATEPFGMVPLFRASRGGLHYFSTSALALACPESPARSSSRIPQSRPARHAPNASRSFQPWCASSRCANARSSTRGSRRCVHSAPVASTRSSCAVPAIPRRCPLRRPLCSDREAS